LVIYSLWSIAAFITAAKKKSPFMAKYSILICACSLISNVFYYGSSNYMITCCEQSIGISAGIKSVLLITTITSSILFGIRTAIHVILYIKSKRAE
jgi:hypothetical protein